MGRSHSHILSKKVVLLWPLVHIKPMSKDSGICGLTPKYRPGLYGPHVCPSAEAATEGAATTAATKRPAARSRGDGIRGLMLPCRSKTRGAGREGVEQGRAMWPGYQVDTHNHASVLVMAVMGLVEIRFDRARPRSKHAGECNVSPHKLWRQLWRGGLVLGRRRPSELLFGRGAASDQTVRAWRHLFAACHTHNG